VEDGGKEGSSQGGDDKDGTPSWVPRGFESAEVEQKHFERMCVGIAESEGACTELDARIKELERESSKHRG